jgi:hypothetical protein
MLLDRERRPCDVDLLDHPRRGRHQRLQAMSATGAEVQTIIEGPGVDGLGRECGALVLGVSWLTVDATPGLARRGRGLGRLDDVG